MVVISVEELTEIIDNSIKKALSVEAKAENEYDRQMGTNEAIQYINSLGIKLSRSAFQKLSAEKSIPFVKFRHKCYFYKNEIDEWIKGTLIRMCRSYGIESEEVFNQ